MWRVEVRVVRTLREIKGSAFASLPMLRLRSIQRLLVCGIILIGLIVLAAALVGQQFRESALAESEREHQNLAYLLAEHFGRQLEALSTAQNEIAKTLVAHAIPLDGNRFSMTWVSSNEAIDRTLKSHPHIAHIGLFDANARSIAVQSRGSVTSPLDWGRELVEELRADRDRQEILRPLRPHSTGPWFLIVAKSIRTGDGHFLGATLGAIDLDVWQSMPTSLSLKAAERIAMLHVDGTLILRYPAAGADIGRKFPMIVPRTPLTDAHPLRTFRVKSPVDGDERIGAVRKLQNLPLLISANTTAREAIADWSRHARALALTALVGILLVGVILVFVARQVFAEYARAEQKLEHERKKLDLALNNMTQGLLLYDSSNRLQICNRSYLEMFKLSPAVVKPGCSFRDVVRHRQETGSFSGDFDAYCSAIEADVALDRVERRLVKAPNGRVVQMSTKRLPGGSWITTMEDVTELQGSNERIAHMAMHDALTGLANRRQFHERLEQALGELTGDATLALLLVDLDDFKAVNDTHGHGAGDALLVGFAHRLIACAGETAHVARLGGDEFAVILPRAGADEAQRVADAILSGLDMPIAAGRHVIKTHASIGIDIAKVGQTDPDQVSKRADLAMYAAKAAGRGSCRVFEMEMEAEAMSRQMLEQDLRVALEEGQLEVHYQPIVSLQTSEVVGREALVRWRHPVRGMISPADFIPIAEETQLIVALGKFVLTEACRQAVHWPKHTYVSVNVSPIQFRTGSFALDTIAALAASGLEPNRLVLEVTETVLLQRETVVLETMRRLRAIGVQIALDDFGTGYSSLSYLQRFPFDKIKIDRSFISTLATTKGATEIVAAIVALANAVGMTTTAEGVESDEQRAILSDLGCDEAQGYLFGKPMSAGDAAQSHAA